MTTIQPDCEPTPPPQPIDWEGDECAGDPSHQWHAHDDDPEVIEA